MIYFRGMIQFVFAVVIGKLFFDLAKKYEKSKWAYGLLSALIFFVLQFVVGFLYVFINYEFNLNLPLQAVVISIVALAVSLGILYVVHNKLKRKWENEQEKNDKQLLYR